MNEQETIQEKAILVGCQLPHITDEHFENSMEELASLTKTADGKVLTSVTQKRNRADAATYIGKGKVEELKALVEELEADLLIFNDELSPSQLKSLATAIEVKMIDRTQLILDIFAKRARTREGKLQIELAQLQYALPRLTGQGINLSRQGGGIGARYPGKRNWKPTAAISEIAFMKSTHSFQLSFAIEADTVKEERKTVYFKLRLSAIQTQGNQHGSTA